MALLLRDLLAAGAPPSAATPPLTPEEVADSYATEAQPGSDGGQVAEANEATTAAGDPDASGT